MDEPFDFSRHAPFAVAVDLVVLAIRDGGLRVLVINRGGRTKTGQWALPGGFVRREQGKRPESLYEAAVRELREETGLGLKQAPYLAQLGAYGDPGRDPRGDSVTVAYLVVRAEIPALHPGGDAQWLGWLPIIKLVEGVQLAFDHNQIVMDAVERVRELIQYTALATAFCGPRFGISDLRRVYEIVWDLPPNGLRADNFHHRVKGMEGLLQMAKSQDRPRVLDALGLEVDPVVQASSHSLRTARNFMSLSDATVITSPAEWVELPTLPTSASSPRRGPRPKLYEPGPAIQAGGPMTLLERPILNPLRGVAAE